MPRSSRTQLRPLTAVPDPRKRLSDGVLVEGCLRARLIGIPILKVEATIVLAPAGLTAPNSAPRDLPTEAPRGHPARHRRAHGSPDKGWPRLFGGSTREQSSSPKRDRQPARMPWTLAAPRIGPGGTSRCAGWRMNGRVCRPADAAVEGDQLLEGAALVELGVVEAADHDVGDVLEAVGAQQVLWRVRRERARAGPRPRRGPPRGSGRRGRRARPRRARTSGRAASRRGDANGAPAMSCGCRSSISSSVSRRRSSIR